MTDASKPAPATGAQQPHKTTNTDKVFIFDTTLRDGEQCPGATMTFEEKLEVADFLDAMGVDIIEAGFPIASEGDFHAVSEIAKRLKRSVVCGLSRAGELDIDRAGEAVKHAARPRIHTFIATSPVHRKHKLKKSAEEVLEMIHFQVSRARNWVPDVEWSAEDATRTEIDYLCRCVETALKAGATTINLPDTVGYATPEEYYQMFRDVMEKVPGSEKAIFSVHCHNDLGMAVANSLAGIRAGCRQIECTINGIGERAGNAALEEVVMAIKTRGDVLPYEVGIDATMLNRASKLVAAATSFPVQYNKAIVGRNAFAHESGIHQDGMLKHTQTYEIMTPESVGVSKTSLVMGKHSGRNAFRCKLKEMGYELGDNALEDAFNRFKALADRKKHVYDEDLEALVDEEIATAQDRMKVVALHRHRRHHGPAVGDADARHGRRQAADRAVHRQRPGGCHLQRHPQAGAAQGQARALPGARRHRGHRRAGRGVGAARGRGRGRPRRDRARGRPRHAGGERQGVSLRPQQAVRQARPPARAAECVRRRRRCQTLRV